MLSRDFDSEIVENGETLRIFDKDREVSLSSMRLTKHDGTPMVASDVFHLFPPKELQGTRYEHHTEGLRGTAIWMQGLSDSAPPCWVLMAVTLSETIGKAARCTVVAPKFEDCGWAVDVWRSIVLWNPDAPVRLRSEPES